MEKEIHHRKCTRYDNIGEEEKEEIKGDKLEISYENILSCDWSVTTDRFCIGDQIYCAIIHTTGSYK